MVFNIALSASLTIFGIGLIRKVSIWFRRRVGIDAENYSARTRLWEAVKGIFKVCFSRKFFALTRAFILDVLLQMRILKEDFLRWLTHMLIFVGFMLLLLMHALSPLITVRIFSDYYPTANPFLFLRNFFGLMVLAGVGLALLRRFVLRVPRLTTQAVDIYAVSIVAVIMLSGFLLEGAKIGSPTVFRSMVDNYAGLGDETEVQALEAFWVTHYGLASADVQAPFDVDVLEQGREISAENCAGCHAANKWAFGGYAAARLMRPLALGLDASGGAGILWYIHILACFAGLAYLPFSKMFHLIATPISLLAAAVMTREAAHPANMVTRRAMELDACTRCGTCSLRCSVAPAFDRFGNSTILPSERMAFLKAYSEDKKLGEEGLAAIQEGIYLCTNCDRCTLVCPAGIDLRELWFSVREDFIRKGGAVALMLTPFSFYRGLNRPSLEPASYARPLAAALESVCAPYKMIDRTDQVVPLNKMDKSLQREIGASAQAAGAGFAYCFSCQNCSTVCPVVTNYEDPLSELKLLPHQIMRAVGLGLRDLALGSKMLWCCTTCYQCQEYCPQGVKVTDILYELKNKAVKESGRPI